jgi:hypothetical protein
VKFVMKGGDVMKDELSTGTTLRSAN